MLHANFQPGDDRLIHDVITRPKDDDAHHRVGLALMNIMETHPEQDYTTLLRHLYETAPCSLCRNSFVERLNLRSALPTPALAECHFDADKHTRQLARQRVNS